MAVWLDIQDRLNAGPLSADGVTVHAVYHERLPRWLASAWAEAQAGEGLRALAINAKGLPVDGVLCVLSLSELERLVQRGAE